MTLNCIAIDDEPLALGLICDYIRQTSFLRLKGSYTCSVDALQVVRNDKVDLVFLDIRMPDLNGIELAKILDWGQPAHPVRIIFTTAFDQYAIEGFKLDAIDYLLKPFNFTDFCRAANKAYRYFKLLANNGIWEKAIGQVLPPEEAFLYVRVEYQLVKLPLNDILYIESLKDYVKIFLAAEAEPVVSLITLKSLDDKLSNKGFMRVHRSFIVARNKIKSVTKNSVQIKQTVIPVTEQYRSVFNSFYKSWLEQSG